MYKHNVIDVIRIYKAKYIYRKKEKQCQHTMERKGRGAKGCLGGGLDRKKKGQKGRFVREGDMLAISLRSDRRII